MVRLLDAVGIQHAFRINRITCARILLPKPVIRNDRSCESTDLLRQDAPSGSGKMPVSLQERYKQTSFRLNGKGAKTASKVQSGRAQRHAASAAWIARPHEATKRELTKPFRQKPSRSLAFGRGPLPRRGSPRALHCPGLQHFKASYSTKPSPVRQATIPGAEGWHVR